MVQGQVTSRMLRDIGVAHGVLPDYNEGVEQVLATAYKYMEESNAPFALLVKRQNFDRYIEEGSFMVDFMMPREEVLTAIIETFSESALVATTGFTSREVFEVRECMGHDHSHDLLTVGSMGHCSSLALGVALARAEREVVCIDGDGAALMHLGAFHTIGTTAPKNLKHVVINNGMHDSVGGQRTHALEFDFAGLAKGSGYTWAKSVQKREELFPALLELRDTDGPCFLEVKVRGGARGDLGRPTTHPAANKRAFMQFLGGAGDSPGRHDTVAMEGSHMTWTWFPGADSPDPIR